MPYKVKEKKKLSKKKKILLFGIITAAVLLIAAGTVLALYLLNGKSSTVMSFEDRIVVPDGHFTSHTEKTDVKDEVKAVRIKPGEDFYKDDSQTEESVGAQIDVLLKKVKEFSFNTVILDLARGDQAVFSSSVLSSTQVDVLKLLISKASQNDITVGVSFPLKGIKKADGTLIDSVIPYENKSVLVDAVSEIVTGYEIESLSIRNYDAQADGESYAEFVRIGTYKSFDDFLKESVSTSLVTVIERAKLAKQSLAVGLEVDSVWANATTEGGSSTEASYQALINGFADTKAIVSTKLPDFIEVKANTSLSDKKAPFKTVVSWWNNVCTESGTPLYVLHSGENAVRKDLEGWSGTDELARQVSTALKVSNYHGSIFSGFTRLIENPSGSTDNLLRYYANEYSEEELFQGLEFTSPTKTSFVTYEETYQFRMKFDPNAEVTLNGKKVVPSQRGGASVWVPLNIGKNQITLEHKGRTTVFNIERKVVILKSVSPTKSMSVEGSSQVGLTVVAYKDSKITATINGTTVTLKQGGGEETGSESAYVTYVGSYKVPKGTQKEQALGNIVFKGTYKGYSETIKGAYIKVNKLVDDVDPDASTGVVLQHAVITSNYADTYPYKTTPGYPQAILYQLPYGTMDIVQSKSGNFLNLRSGKTILASAANLEDVAFEGNNRINSVKISSSNNYTELRFALNWKSPFSLTPSPYPTEPEQTASNFSFNANTITLLLDYTTMMDEKSISGKISSSPLFSSISYERVYNQNLKIYQYKVTLKLKQSGRYYGCHTVWDGNTLVFRFNHPGSSSSLSGLKICIDPGHGGNDPGNMAGQDIIEKDANLNQALILGEVLSNYGADVIYTREGDSNPSLYRRVDIAEENYCNLFISVHYNSAGNNSTPSGVQTYFNAPFSYPLAKYVQAQLNSVMPNVGWNRVGSSIPNYNFVVTREKQFPSILIECGFLSNPSDEALAMDNNHLYAMAEAIAQGVMDYYGAYN